jgi:RNA polymerase sigma-70 factor (ECF subfamily)
MMGLFLEDAVCDVVGMVSEEGVDAIREGSILHTFSDHMTSRYRAEVRQYDGEPVVVLFGWDVDASGRPVNGEEPTDVVRFETVDGKVRRMRWYYFCPETLTEVGLALGLTMDTHGYRYD